MQEFSQKTLWLGNIDQSTDETYLRNIFMGEIGLVNIKLIRDKSTQALLGYGFLEFSSTPAAQQCLERFASKQIPGAGYGWKLNWAQHGGTGTGGGSTSGGPRPGEFSMYIGDLDPDITEQQLGQIFKMRYPSCTGAKIVSEPYKSNAKGYGFVRFQSEKDASACLAEMQGAVIGCRAIRISHAAPKGQTPLAPATSTKEEETSTKGPAYPGSYAYYMMEYYRNMAMYAASQAHTDAVDTNYFVKPYDTAAANRRYMNTQNARASYEQWFATRTSYGIPITSLTPYVCTSSQL